MAIPELIYCAGKNLRCDTIAQKAGFKLGARLPDTTIYFPPYFIDQDWKRAKDEPGYRDKYMATLALWKPTIATVIDWERWDQLPEVLSWAKEAAGYVLETVIIIPKVIGGIKELRRFVDDEGKIGGKEIRLGYSVQTGFSGTPVPPSEFLGWPVHLLGGSPHKQASMVAKPIALDLKTDELNVVSLDGNMFLKMATRRAAFFTAVHLPGTKNHPWPTLKDVDGKAWGDGSNKTDAPYEAFRRSCENIMAMWQGLK